MFVIINDNINPTYKLAWIVPILLFPIFGGSFYIFIGRNKIGTRSYYRVLIESGVRIYEYTPGFIHSKTFISDDEYGVVGTINMDPIM